MEANSVSGVQGTATSEKKEGIKKDSETGKKGRPNYANGQDDKNKSETLKMEPTEKVEINLQTLLEAGVHFGHQTSRWSPAMAQYIYTSRNGIHIINLPKTMQLWEKARKAIFDVVADGGNVMFVGTKKQAKDPIKSEAERSGCHYVSNRWLGGMMTNFNTIKKSIERMNKITQILDEENNAVNTGGQTKFTKKERLMMTRELEKLDFTIGGIKTMYTTPDLLFVVDIKREDIAVKEAQRLDIPVVAVVDTNCNPADVQYPIASNDDGTRAIRLFCQAVADVIVEAKAVSAQRGNAEGAKRKRKWTPRNENRKSKSDVTDVTNVDGSEFKVEGLKVLTKPTV